MTLFSVSLNLSAQYRLCRCGWLLQRPCQKNGHLSGCTSQSLFCWGCWVGLTWHGACVANFCHCVRKILWSPHVLREAATRGSLPDICFHPSLAISLWIC